MVMILRAACKQCAECYNVCSEAAITKEPDVIYPREWFNIDPDKCTNCRKCIPVCRWDAIID